MPRIVCVIIHHHGAEMLAASVRSVLKSVGVFVEIVVVSNACDEPLPGWFDDVAGIHILRPDHELGFAEANNFAVRWIGGALDVPDAYLFMNNDASLEPNSLGRLTSVLGSNSRCGAVGPKILVWGAPEYLNSLGLNVTEVAEAWDEGIGERAEPYSDDKGDREVLAATGAVLLVSSRAFEEIGGWSEIYDYYMEDIDLCIRLWSAGWSVRVAPEALAYHAISASTGGGVSDFKRFHTWRNQYLLMAVHWPTRVLIRVMPRFVATQIVLYVERLRIGAREDARIQMRAFLGALQCMPTAALQRMRHRRDYNWKRFLKKAGSVPVIKLPLVSETPWTPERESGSSVCSHVGRISQKGLPT